MKIFRGSTQPRREITCFYLYYTEPGQVMCFWPYATQSTCIISSELYFAMCACYKSAQHLHYKSVVRRNYEDCSRTVQAVVLGPALGCFEPGPLFCTVTGNQVLKGEQHFRTDRGWKSLGLISNRLVVVCRCSSGSKITLSDDLSFLGP